MAKNPDRKVAGNQNPNFKTSMEKHEPRNRYFFLRKSPHQFNFRCPIDVTRNKEYVLSEYAQWLALGAECILYEIDGPTGEITRIG